MSGALPPDDGRADVLLQQARDGDREAMEALLVRWLPRLREFVHERMSPLLRAREASDDVVQSTCRELLGGLDRCEFRGEEAFRGWLFTAVLHKVQKRERDLRAQRRDPRVEQPLAETPTHGQPPAPQPTPSQDAIAHERRARLEAAIAALPEDYREVLALARLAQLPRAEIAARLGRSEASVRSLLTRALQALGERLAHDRSSGS
jgi:RNA polymerase sigma-70 factor (ECF subfamily)